MLNAVKKALELVTDRVCRDCGELKSVADFYARYVNQCKICRNKAQAASLRARRMEEPERYKLKDRLAQLSRAPVKDMVEIAAIREALLSFTDRRTLKQKTVSAEHILRRQKNNNFRIRYGITLGEVEKLFDSQMGLCANRACGKEVSLQGSGVKNKATANVDHCHVTGEVRGILCGACNTALGVLDNKNLVLGLTEYLHKFDSKVK